MPLSLSKRTGPCAEQDQEQQPLAGPGFDKLSQPEGTGFDKLSLPAWSFGNTPELADQLGTLVVQGVKTATSSLLWEYQAEGEALPQAGDLVIILDGAGQPLCIIEYLEVTVRPFDQVSEAHAFEEGEGDRSLAYWRAVHWAVYAQSCAALGLAPQPSMPVVCERFRVVYLPGA